VFVKKTANTRARVEGGRGSVEKQGVREAAREAEWEGEREGAREGAMEGMRKA